MSLHYTETQQRAIDTLDQNLQIIACAGSGKTQVISARIVALLKQPDVEAENIVAFTFTEKAAGELKDRIHRLCKQEIGSTQGLANMFVGTMHGYCLNLLQSPPVYQFLKFTVLEDIQQRLLIDRYSKQSGLTSVPLLKGGTLRRWTDSRLYKDLLSLFREDNPNLKNIPTEVQTAVQQYRDLLKKKRYLDFTVIIKSALEQIQQCQPLREQIASTLKYLVVDEYQDVNPLQERLIHTLHQLGANLCVVGDDDQTIYQWRGSDVSNIIDFANRYASVEQIPLNENFRSSEGVVETARQIVQANGTRLPKQMVSQNAQPFQRGDILALKFKTPDEEAAWIAQRIHKLYGVSYQDRSDAPTRGLTYSDFAVLLRSVKKDAAPIIQALDQAHIPYVVGGMNGLFDTTEVQAVRDMFFYLADFQPRENPQSLTLNDVRQSLQRANLGLSARQITDGADFLQKRKARIGKKLETELFLQQIYLDFLECIGLREDAIPPLPNGTRRGSIVYYNLGKFSQVISDFEQIHFGTLPDEIYSSFASFLYYQAPDYYPEGWEGAGAIKPDAVSIMTVHQAKGMQWPVVFVPCLRRNRFPSRSPGGRSVWHIIPEQSIPNATRYKGTIEDERRLFYVALTRAEKYLYGSWSPVPGNQQQQKPSPFFDEMTRSSYVLTKESSLSLPPACDPKPRKADVLLPLTFSQLKYYFDCPYLFKLRYLYGFNAPISRALGYGHSLHNALAEIHAESLQGNIPDVSEIPRLVDDHLHLPFADKSIEDNMRKGAVKSLTRYLQDHRPALNRLEHVEKVIELTLSDGIVVSGRIDLIRKTDTQELSIVDFKSNQRAQDESLSEKQLQIYALGYQELTGQRADLIEIHNLDRGGIQREEVDDTLIQTTMQNIVEAGKRLRDDDLPRHTSWSDQCQGCDFVGICRKKEAKP